MRNVRLSKLALADIAAILQASEDRQGVAAQQRYQTLIALAVDRIADTTRLQAVIERPEIADGVRCLHLRHVRTRDKDARVEAPVHAIYFQYVGANDVEILRILHERMDPALHIGDEF